MATTRIKSTFRIQHSICFVLLSMNFLAGCGGGALQDPISTAQLPNQTKNVLGEVSFAPTSANPQARDVDNSSAFTVEQFAPLVVTAVEPSLASTTLITATQSVPTASTLQQAPSNSLVAQAKQTNSNAQAVAKNIVKVGSGQIIKTLAQASKIAVNGDIVEVDAGTYLGDVATWPQSNLVIRGVGGQALVDANGGSAQGKAIFVIQGDNVTIENLTFVNCKVDDKNGAGIRHEGGKLVVKASVFRDNENGILTNNAETQSLEVYNSQFINNGDGVGYAHNLYVGQIGKLIVEGSYFTRGKQGHLLKSRAKENYISYNRLTDETGDASYELDLPNGGLSFVIGNVFEQSPNSPNSSIISFGAEGITRWANNNLYFSHNTVVNDRSAGCRFIQARNGAVVHVSNSLFSGQTCNAPQTDTNSFVNSFLVMPTLFVSVNTYDYRLVGTLPFGDAVSIGDIGGTSLIPTKEYVHPAQTRAISGGNLRPGAIQSQ
jgi:hypothetical protein